MNLLYVGDSKKLSSRIRSGHCGGNVEGSALRKLVAEAMGIALSRTKRASGTDRTRLDLHDPRVGERQITTYMRSGFWRVVECETDVEAEAFQWFAIKQMNPLLNRDRRDWDSSMEATFRKLMKALQASELLSWEQRMSLPTGPGVYSFYHESRPQPGMVTE